MENEAAAKMRCVRPVSGYAFTGHVCNATVRDALQIYALE
jgi:hypothetical protein